MTCGGGAGMVGGAAGVLMDLVCQETEPPDKTEDSAIEVWASPNKRDDSGIEVSESPDKRHDSAIGGLEIPAGRSRSRRECRETPDKQDDSAIVVYESPNKRDGSVIGGWRFQQVDPGVGASVGRLLTSGTTPQSRCRSLLTSLTAPQSGLPRG